MKKLPIPEMNQINSMLNNSLWKLICEYYDDPYPYDLNNYVTIDKNKMIEFLKKNPDRAKEYFIEHVKTHGHSMHDIFKIIKENDRFIVTWMDHGVLLTLRQYYTIEEAVAEYLFRNYRIFEKNNH